MLWLDLENTIKVSRKTFLMFFEALQGDKENSHLAGFIMVQKLRDTV